MSTSWQGSTPGASYQTSNLGAGSCVATATITELSGRTEAFVFTISARPEVTASNITLANSHVLPLRLLPGTRYRPESQASLAPDLAYEIS